MSDTNSYPLLRRLLLLEALSLEEERNAGCMRGDGGAESGAAGLPIWGSRGLLEPTTRAGAGLALAVTAATAVEGSGWWVPFWTGWMGGRTGGERHG